MNIDLGFNLTPQLKQSLSLRIDQRLINKLNLLRMPYQVLLNKIKEEIENNIVLDIDKHESLIERINEKNYIAGNKELIGRKDKQIENLSLDINSTLEEHLLNQLSLEILDDIEQKIGREIIFNIDEDGYIKNYSEIREKIKKEYRTSFFKIDKTLKIIQSFEPQGVGARNLKECLLIQINEDNIRDSIFNTRLNSLIKDYSQYIENGNIEIIMKGMNIDESGFKALISYLKGLDPYPGRQFIRSSNKEIVIPSFEIKEYKGVYKAINLEEDYGPKLKIKEKYLKMLDDPKLDQKTKEFIKTKLREAKQLIEDMNNRKVVIEKLLSIIIKEQDSFLKKGIYWLKPFQQDEMAKVLKVHPSTVSRAVRGKYIQTSHGLFPLNFLLPRDQKGFSSQQIKKMINEIVFNNKTKKLSDKNITDILNKEGIQIKRRTVAKYRQELGLVSKRERKIKA